MREFRWKWQDTLIIILGLCSLAYALVNYNKLPAQLPSHFSITGEVNGYWPKGSLIAFGACMGLVFPIAMQFLRKIDPKRENYKKFEHAYKMLRLAIAVLFDAILVFSVTKGLDQNFAAGKAAIAALGLLFIVLGNYMPQVKHNYFMGIRTPWTLADPEVWRKTHRLSGFMWMIGGALILLAAFIPATLSISMIVAALVIATLVPTVYSWVIAQRVKG